MLMPLLRLHCLGCHEGEEESYIAFRHKIGKTSALRREHEDTTFAKLLPPEHASETHDACIKQVDTATEYIPRRARWSPFRVAVPAASADECLPNLHRAHCVRLQLMAWN